ncbi:MAG: homoserine O-succinyltransferase [Bacteroidetes bacterium CG2_30_32_10]|nr:MAG: homoserine O-succinyltransferase [Bacteroidetes bacterium CG2_30_32_10]
MSIIVNDNLFALAPLKKEGFQIEGKSKANIDKNNLLKIAILNLMPNKQTTELQLLRVLNNEQYAIDIEFVYVSSHQSKTTSEEYLKKSYHSFDEIKNSHWDGMIVTGAPVELLDFKEVNYWNELKQIMDWALSNVTSTFFICWGAQAALFHYYNIPKYKLSEKMFGVFNHQINHEIAILKEIHNPYLAPHSRHTSIVRDDIEKVSDLKIISTSEKAGIYILANEAKKQFFVTGHSEYDVNTLKDEYFRDLQKGLPILKPQNYFPNNDENKAPINTWKTNAHLLYGNWLNYYVNSKK